MTERFWRRYINFAGISGDDLDIYFRIKGEEPAICDVTVYNLSQDTISKFKVGDIVELEAGYRDDHGIIFTGKIQEPIETEREGSDIATHFHLADASEYQLQRVISVLNIAKGTPIIDAIKTILTELEIPIGKADAFTTKFDSQIVISDRVAKDILINGKDSFKNELAEKEGSCEFFMRDGKAYIVKEETRDTEKVNLSADTGLLEVEKLEIENEETQESDTRYKIKSLLIWQLRRKMRINLQSKQVSGDFEVVKFEHICNDAAYYTVCEVRAT